jgi:hypothetical protein
MRSFEICLIMSCLEDHNSFQFIGLVFLVGALIVKLRCVKFPRQGEQDSENIFGSLFACPCEVKTEAFREGCVESIERPTRVVSCSFYLTVLFYTTTGLN